MILSDKGIRDRLRKDLIIKPMEPWQVRENGVDLRIGCQYARFKKVDKVLDVNNGARVEEYYELGDACEEGSVIIRPYEHVLLHTVEELRIPEDLIMLVNIKSTLARLGLYIPPTVADAGFQGQLVIEVIGSSFPVKLKPGTPFVHAVFAKLESKVERPYWVRGNYQGQRGVRLPKLPIRS